MKDGNFTAPGAPPPDSAAEEMLAKQAASHKDRQYYLGKGGEKFGPFTHDELEKLRDRDDYFAYRFIWDSADPEWRAIRRQAPRPQTQIRKTPPPFPLEFRAKSIQAVCHDQRSVISGSLEKVTELGCEIITRQKSAGTTFASRSRVVVNLLNTDTGESMNIPAQLTQIERKNGNWAFQIRWNQCPDIMRSH